MTTLTTARLSLTALDPATAAMQVDDVGAFLAHFHAAPLGAWPPEPFDEEVAAWSREGLARDPEGIGWYGWLVFEGGPLGVRRLIGAAMLVGRPDMDGEVELGFGVLPAHQGRGFASETVAALTRWAMANGAARVLAHVAADAPNGARTLAQCGFQEMPASPYPGVAAWSLAADAAP